MVTTLCCSHYASSLDPQHYSQVSDEDGEAQFPWLSRGPGFHSDLLTPKSMLSPMLLVAVSMDAIILVANLAKFKTIKYTYISF